MHFRIVFKQARVYLIILALLHISAALVFFTYYQGATRWLLLVLMLISYIYSLYCYRQSFFRVLEIRPHGKVLLQREEDIEPIVATLRRVSFKNNYWMIVQWQAKKRQVTQIIARDMCHAEEYHQLFLCLNWTLPQSTEI